jgi:hypothetical protein
MKAFMAVRFIGLTPVSVSTPEGKNLRGVLLILVKQHVVRYEDVGLALPRCNREGYLALTSSHGEVKNKDAVRIPQRLNFKESLNLYWSRLPGEKSQN